MSENSAIEWTDHTFNPWIGCTKVSPGCDNCYAARQDGFRHWTPEGWGGPRKRTKTWGDPVKWNAAHAAFYAQHGRRQRVFCASLADVFDNEVPAEWRADLFALIEKTPHLDWLLLTKRIGNVARMLVEILRPGTLPPNVWLGATVVNQAEADRDIPKLLALPAAVRFLSCEPLLGPIDLTAVRVPFDTNATLPVMPNIDWVIVGGESGPKARPMHPEWARSLRDQCEAAGVRLFFKQWGEHSLHEIGARGQVTPPMSMNLRGMKEWRPDLQRFAAPAKDAMAGEVFTPGAVLALPVGKAAAGRLLDGRTHDEFPRA